MSYYICKKCGKMFSGPPSNFIHYEKDFPLPWHICKEEKMVEPIKPEEINEAKAKTIPSEVIESFNHMIAKNWNGSQSRFKQDDVVENIVSRMNKNNVLSQHEIDVLKISLFSNHNLDVEDLYRAQGWKVEYDKPAYCETYPATFTFSKK